MKKYETYIESGVDWIGEIPEKWNLLKIGRTFSNIGSGTTPKSTNSKFYENGNINWLNTGDLNDDYIYSTKKKITSDVVENSTTLKLHPIESVVIALYGATIGKLGYLKIESTTNQACCVLSNSDKITQRFLFYYFLGAREFIVSKSYGGGQPNISQELIKQLYIASPSLQEQTQIANYLDHKTQLIDELIAKKELLVKKLQAQRQAIINEAVTKGINKNVTLKDSGIEWLGEIPEHWEVVKLNYLTSKIGDGLHSTPKYTEDEDYYFINGNNLNDGRIEIQAKTRTVNKTEFEKLWKEIDNTTLLLSINGTIGNVALYNNEKVILGKSACFINCGKRINRKFLMRVFQSRFYKNYFMNEVTGTTIYNLSLETIRNCKIVLPSISEQLSILEFLKVQLEKFDKLLEDSTISIKKLKNYRQAIISEAVTGKIDVRNWQPPKNK